MRALFLIALFLFTGCVVSVQRPTPAPAPAPSSQPVLLNTRLGMPLYPGAQLVTLDGSGNGSSSGVFETGDAISEVYGYYHNQFSARGWARTDLDFKDKATKLEASYQRQGVRLRFALDQQGKSGRYRFEFRF